MGNLPKGGLNLQAAIARKVDSAGLEWNKWERDWMGIFDSVSAVILIAIFLFIGLIVNP